MADGPARSNERKPFSLGGPAVIIAIDDEMYDEVASSFGDLDFGAGAPRRFVRASELHDPHTEADLYLGRYIRTTPTCEKVLQFANGGRIDTFEQDQFTGAVYRTGKLVWPSAPLAIANMNGGTVLAPLADAALYFALGPRIRITTIPDIFVVVRPVTTRAPGPSESVLPDWIERARRDLARPGPRVQ
jgi:hypothetical protein